MADPIYPFHCGTQYGDWSDSNCVRCVHGAEAHNQQPVCEIEKALLTAFAGDGTVTPEIAARMGHTAHSPPAQERHSYVWPCNEWEPTEEAKAEYRRKHPEEFPAVQEVQA